MKFAIKYLKEITDVIDAESLQHAAQRAIIRSFREDDCKVLSIHEIKEGEPLPPKNPTPFDRPPSGTPGAGQMRVTQTELMARAA